jgi:hypothetical protein
VGVRENHSLGELDMSIRRYKPEQIVTLLRQIEVEIANGKTTPQAAKKPKSPYRLSIGGGKSSTG